MDKPKLFQVELPQITKARLLSDIQNLNTDSKQSLYFFYSEFLLRANRNIYYNQVLNSADMKAIDGRGLQWALWRAMNYQNKTSKFNWISFVVELIKNLISGFIVLAITKNNLLSETQNEVILGRDFIYDIFELASEKSWKIMIIGGGNLIEARNKLVQKYPNINFEIVSFNSNSRLMKDLPQNYPTSEIDYLEAHRILNDDNLNDCFDELKKAEQKLEQEEFDLILVCLGGASGKQEFFIHKIKQNPNINFRLAIGLGAALDHLGGGKQQSVAPIWMQKSGLEWVYRFIALPYRRKRIYDSIVTLWWWTSLQKFVPDNRHVNLENAKIESKNIK